MWRVGEVRDMRRIFFLSTDVEIGDCEMYGVEMDLGISFDA